MNNACQARLGACGASLSSLGSVSCIDSTGAACRTSKGTCMRSAGTSMAAALYSRSWHQDRHSYIYISQLYQTCLNIYHLSCIDSTDAACRTSKGTCMNSAKISKAATPLSNNWHHDRRSYIYVSRMFQTCLRIHHVPCIDSTDAACRTSKGMCMSFAGISMAAASFSRSWQKGPLSSSWRCIRKSSRMSLASCKMCLATTSSRSALSMATR